MIFAYDDRSNVEEEMFLCYECIEKGIKHNRKMCTYIKTPYIHKNVFILKNIGVYICVFRIFFVPLQSIYY